MPDTHFTTPRPVRLVIKIAAGDFRIATVDGDESTVSLEGSSKLLAATRVELHGDRLVVEQYRKSLRTFLGHWSESLEVVARVPHGSSVEIVTASGDATLEGTFAALEMQSASGDITAVGDLDGSATVHTVSGDVSVGRVAGDLMVHTVSGDVEAESVGGSVSAKGVSGDVRVRSLRQGSVNVHSVSGDVELGIASGSSVDVDAGSASGDLSSEVPLSGDPSAEEGPTVVIRSSTVSGDFRLTRAA